MTGESPEKVTGGKSSGEVASEQTAADPRLALARVAPAGKPDTSDEARSAERGSRPRNGAAGSAAEQSAAPRALAAKPAAAPADPADSDDQGPSSATPEETAETADTDDPSDRQSDTGGDSDEEAKADVSSDPVQDPASADGLTSGNTDDDVVGTDGTHINDASEDDFDQEPSGAERRTEDQPKDADAAASDVDSPAEPSATTPSKSLAVAPTEPPAVTPTKPPATAATEPPAGSAAPATGESSAASTPPRPPLPPITPPPPPAYAPVERASQQPLPPAPADPLKLLAQLTNKPPRPQTPLTSVLRRIKIWSPVVVLLAIIFTVLQLVRPLPAASLQQTATSSYSFDGSQPQLPWPAGGQAAIEVDGLGSLGSSGEDDPVPIASVTKTMTAYLILKDHPLKKGERGPEITVDQKAVDDYKNGGAEGESVVKVAKGQKLTLKEALEDLMVPSANNIARLLARWDAGSEDAFAKKMNDAAADLGMTKTTYTDPSGLDATTVSTAKDQVKLAQAALDNTAFRAVVATPQIKRGNTVLYNNNSLLLGNGVIGIKTGSSTKAGGNLLFAAEKKIGGTKQLIIGAVLGQYKTPILDSALNASRDLLVAVQQSLTTVTLIKKGDVVGHVDDGLGGKTPVVAAKDVTVVGWAGLKVKLHLTGTGEAIPHKASAGVRVGTLTAGSGQGQVKVPVTVQTDLGEPSIGSRLTRVV